ncbi:hypothetical protein ACFYNW_34745 [Streptomyces virginiae]|uniref:hypothetical protein n=1 Tax=Streptomyces virginiae TaxID=1961 RepID=UPI0036E6EFFF
MQDLVRAAAERFGAACGPITSRQPPAAPPPALPPTRSNITRPFLRADLGQELQQMGRDRFGLTAPHPAVDGSPGRRINVLQDRFPGLVAAAEQQLPGGLVLDGELLVWGAEAGRLSFEGLQRRPAGRGRTASDPGGAVAGRTCQASRASWPRA